MRMVGSSWPSPVMANCRTDALVVPTVCELNTNVSGDG
jgi:hypothetical protein